MSTFPKLCLTQVTLYKLIKMLYSFSNNNKNMLLSLKTFKIISFQNRTKNLTKIQKSNEKYRVRCLVRQISALVKKAIDTCRTETPSTQKKRTAVVFWWKWPGFLLFAGKTVGFRKFQMCCGFLFSLGFIFYQISI